MLRIKYENLLVLFLVLQSARSVSDRKFPDDFIFGCATASYQIEGAWNEDGKGENIWDRLTHEKPEYITDKSSGDIACDSYHKYLEDVELLKELGVDFYRFSISWSRILPNFTERVNKKGIEYYNNLINALLANGIKPMVTLYHWDLPQYLQDIGGWTNPHIVDHYEFYARVVFENFGDRVPHFITFNEPKQICQEGYGDEEKAPAINRKGIAEYLCGHNLLKAHARAYHLYDEEYRPKYNGKVGITIYSQYFDPHTESCGDRQARERALQFFFGWWANPVYGPKGNYPQVLIDRIAERSGLEGYRKSRLPAFTNEEIKYIKGSADFLGLNHYTTRYAENIPEPEIGEPSWENDMRVRQVVNESWPQARSDWIRVVPWGLRKMLVWIKEQYGDVPIIITENGVSDSGEIDDCFRVDYYRDYLGEVLAAKYDHGVNIIGYTAWSLLDNFEWFRGYTERFGLYAIDFDSPSRTRTEKTSAMYYRHIIASRSLEWKKKRP
ncbi:glycoside hydrolase, partial [Rhyzopertha dominica]